MRLTSFVLLIIINFALLICARPTRRACTIHFDGRIASSVQAADFDAETSVFNNENVHGQNQTFADIISFPDVPPSLFDAAVGTKAFEITLTDDSIFVPGGGEPQLGFRRSEVIPASNNGTDATTEGMNTIHWSLRSDPVKLSNLSHEHQLVFHETSDFSTSQFMLKTGTPMGQTFVESEHKTLRLEDRQTAAETLFSTPFEDDVWHNFAVIIGFNSTDFTIYYSKDLDPLQVVDTTTNERQFWPRPAAFWSSQASDGRQ